LRGRLPIHQGNGFILAETGGAEEITLTVNQIPITVTLQVVGMRTETACSPNGGLPASNTTANAYGALPPQIAAAPQTVSPTGGSQPHTNFQPYLCVDFIISLFGIFPSPT
jgi:microcystin-dependent protein